MKSVNYSRYTGDELGISAEDLMRALGDYFLRSGFEQQFFDLSDMDLQNLDDLRDVIREALESGELFGDQEIEKMNGAPAANVARGDAATRRPAHGKPGRGGLHHRLAERSGPPGASSGEPDRLDRPQDGADFRAIPIDRTER